MGGGGGGWSPGALNVFPGGPGPIASLPLGALILFSVEPGALKTFAAEPEVPNIKIRTFLHTDSVITCLVCCFLGMGTKIVKNQ